MIFFRVFYGEWLKRRRSFASAAVIGAALFTPAVVAFVRLIKHRGLPAIYGADAFWPALWRSCWESMAVFFLPLGAILATSLVTQIEFRGNAWKQVRTLPLSAAVLFFAKLGVIVVMLGELLLLFSAGVYVSGMLPALLVPGVPHPKGSFLGLPLLRENALYFVDALPIVAAQYLLALRSPNVLVPIGVGFMAWVGALAAVSSKLAIWWPYAYTTVNYLGATPKGAHLAGGGHHWLAAVFFVVLTLVSLVLFVRQREKG
jgi:lantibiotic transport system permease protein